MKKGSKFENFHLSNQAEQFEEKVKWIPKMKSQIKPSNLRKKSIPFVSICFPFVSFCFHLFPFFISAIEPSNLTHLFPFSHRNLQPLWFTPILSCRFFSIPFFPQQWFLVSGDFSISDCRFCWDSPIAVCKMGRRSLQTWTEQLGCKMGHLFWFHDFSGSRFHSIDFSGSRLSIYVFTSSTASRIYIKFTSIYSASHSSIPLVSDYNYRHLKLQIHRFRFVCVIVYNCSIQVQR